MGHSLLPRAAPVPRAGLASLLGQKLTRAALFARKCQSWGEGQHPTVALKTERK